MIPEIRAAFNRAFTPEKYEQFTLACQERFNKKIEFKICETPVFVSKAFSESVIEAGDAIIEQLTNPAFLKHTDAAIPNRWRVPGEEGKPVFLALDFGICQDAAGNLIPQLIEMQGFASLYAWQHELGRQYRNYYPIPDTVHHLFNGLDDQRYRQLLKDTIVGHHDPKEVVILEVQPEHQKTWIDFYLTREMLGIQPICITEVIKEGKELYYLLNGEKTRIRRIYNRLIFDELGQRTDLNYAWNMTDEAEVEWVCHPNWFFRISKYTMPFLKHASVPETLFLNQVKEIPSDLDQWVLKPLFSFAGHGVIFHLTREDVEKAMLQADNFILQRKVQYKAIVETPDEPAKAELRLMYLWLPGTDKPTLVTNLARLSKGVMIGVDYNRNKTWVGGTVGYYAD